MTGYYTGGYTVTENGSAYDRGVAAGEIAARLANHDKHFAVINGHMGRTADELRELRLAVQRLADAAAAAAATAAATEQALSHADQMRLAATDRRWTPWARATALIGALAALAGIIFGIWALTRP